MIETTGAQPPEANQPETKSPADQSKRRAAILIVFFVVFIDLLGFGIVIPLLPLYAKQFLEPLLPGPGQEVFQWMVLGLLMSCFSIMQFIFAPIWGRISDQRGRRPILLLG